MHMCELIPVTLPLGVLKVHNMVKALNCLVILGIYLVGINGIFRDRRENGRKGRIGNTHRGR